jgi:EpsI family protein
MLTILQRHAPAIVMLGATLAITYAVGQRRPEPLKHPLESVSDQLAGWTRIDSEPVTPSMLSGLKLTSYLSRTYRKHGQHLGLFIAYYALQRGGETMHSPKHCLPGTGWEIWKQGQLSVTVHGHAVTVNQDSISNADRRMVMLYWYQSQRRIFANEYMGKGLLLWDAVTEGRTGGSLVRIILPERDGIAADGAQFVEQLIPQLEQCFGG